MNYTLRQCTYEDLDFIVELKRLGLKWYIEKIYGWDEKIQTQKTIKELERNIDNTQIILVNGKKVGVTVFYKYKEEYCIGLTLVHPDYQNKKIATDILTKYIETARNENKRIIIKTYKENRAINLYERLGFNQYSKDETHIYLEINFANMDNNYKRMENKVMDINEICYKVDHTLLSQTATWEEIERVCKEAVKYKTASVCIPPSYVKQVKDSFGEMLKVCTVIGFPNGYNTTKVKVFETEEALLDGADEIDMVINISWLKDRKYDKVLEEIKEIKNICGEKVLKVIIETYLLSDEEKIKMCEIINQSGADYIKTSTGFSKSGATFCDIELFSKNINDGVKIKAAGGISSLEDAKKFIELGASRLGTSKIIKLIEEN